MKPIRIHGVALIDFESRSRCALKKRGGRNYWADPSTEAICAVLHDVERGRRYTWVPGDPPPVLGTAVAHNGALFDRFAAAKYGWRVHAWLDSSHLAKRSGLPGALDELAQRRLGREKDKAGNRFTLALSRPSRAAATRGAMPELTPAVRERVVQYCANDVEVMVDAWPELQDWSDVDADVAAVDLAINDRGIALDTDLVRALQAQLVRLQGIAVRDSARALGWSEADTRRGARSVPIFRHATGLPNAQKETLAAAVATGRVHPLVQARAALASVVPGKLAAALQFANSDGRVRDSHLYYGAHAQPLSEPIHTPMGWTTMGAVRVGDWVSGARAPVRVMGVFPQGERQVFRVSFSDGAWVRCDAEHLWAVEKNGHRRVLRTCDLGELKQTFRSSNNGYAYRVPLWIPPVEPRSDLPLDPYTLGAMLGDGCMVGKTPRFTSQDPEIPAAFVLPESVYLVERGIEGKAAKHYTLSSGVGGRWRKNPMRQALEDLNLWGCDSYTKFVPQMYLHADTASRHALLQGLLDTDGSATSAGVAKYCSCSVALRDAAIQLVRSLGGVARVRTSQMNGKPLYAIECRLPARFPAFRLARKLNKHAGQERRNPARSIVSVEPDGVEECQCISVDSGDHLYVTRDYVLTHNTGRWSSKGIQLHNLPRVSFEKACTGRFEGWAMQDYIEALADYALDGGEVSAREVSGLLRSVLVASPGCELQVLDYSGIEARVTAWAAGDEAALEVFAAYDAGTGPDPYCVAATGIFGYPVSKKENPEERGLGKIAELGLGYQMGAPKFEMTCLKAGVMLSELGLDADRVVSSWRKLRRAVVQLWYACQRAFVRAAEGRRSVVGPWVYDSMGDRDVVCVLPSGRPIVYRDVHVRHGDRGPSCSYQGRKKWREHVYGGMLVENAVQATCRDLLAQALIRLEHDGLSPVLHVHDEAVCENAASVSAEALAEMRRVMSDAPEWAAGVPLAFDGFRGRRYRK